ncbi:DMT family transporter [Bacillus songklensis]|uniref:DMT family transporter n=1 Tax=Bacillus songklensis TaxID=1069116 RepID=A0ABV8B3E6_9BACI
MGELLAFVALILFSANIIITKMAAARLNLNLGFLISVGVNVLFASFLFLIQVLFFEGGIVDWNTKGFFLFLSAGLFSTYLGRWFFFETIDKLGPTRASAFQVSNPLFTTIIAWLFMGEKLGWMDLSAIILILLGLFLVSYISQSSVKREIAVSREPLGMQSVNEFSFKWLLQSGVLLAFLSSFSYAVGNVVRGAAIQNWNQPILGGILGALLGFLLHVATNKNTRDFWGQIRKSDSTGVLLYVISGVITISAQISVIASMRYIPISIANLITLSTPVIVTPLSFILFKNQEGITYRTIMGIILVLGGICFIVL